MGLRDILFRKQREVERLYTEYLECWKACTDSFSKAMEIYLESGNKEEFAFWVDNTHKKESLADDQRRLIEYELYAKALLPESRGDILGVLETVDKVINKVEAVLFQIQREQIELPELLVPYVRRIIDTTNEALKLAHEAAARCFREQGQILDLAKQMDRRESECDHAERGALEDLFASDLPLALKLQMKDLIIEMGNITDRIETLADRLVIVSVKRRV